MAKTRVQFTEEVGLAPTPQAPSGELLISAAEKNASAEVQSAKAKGSVLQSDVELAAGAVRVGMEVAKGKLKSDMETAIKKTVDSYDASVKVDTALTKLTLFDQGLMEGTPKEVEDAKATLIKYKDSLDQGVMTREQALLSIDKSVKDFSRIMPGWSTEFRKLAYELTGIEHMGAYKEYALLSGHDLKDAATKKALDFQQKLFEKQIMMFTEKYGRPPMDGLKGGEMTIFRQGLALSAHAETLKKEIEVRDAQVSVIEPKVVDFMNTQMASGMLTLSQHLQGIPVATDPKTGKPFSAESKVLLRQRVLTDIGSHFEQLKGQLLGFNSNQLSNATREQLINRLNTQQKELTDALKNQDSFDDFKKTMEIRSASAKDVMNQWAIAHPNLEIIRQTGIATPELARVWIDSQREPGRASFFRKTYGPALDDYYRSITTGGKATADSYTRDGSHATNDAYVESLRLTNPASHQEIVTRLRDHLITVSKSGWGETPEIQAARKESFADAIRVFTNQIPATDKNAVNEWSKLMADSRIAQRVKELPAEQQMMASEPIITKSQSILMNAEFGAMKRLSNLSTEHPGGFTIVVGVGGRLQANYAQPSRPKVGQFGVTQGEAVTGRSYTRETLYVPGVRTGFNVDVEEQVAIANRAIQTLENFGAVPTDRKFVNDLQQKLMSGYFAMSYEQRDQSLKSPTQEKPTSYDKNKPGNREEQAMAQKLVLDEKAQLQNDINEYLNATVHLQKIEKELKMPNLTPSQKQILEDERRQIMSINPEEIKIKIQKLLSITGGTSGTDSGADKGVNEGNR